ncbi:MAG: DUF3575 domain-containing protein [Bacteroidales bacterium]|nr:DUF3575 domain-containing protein [Bacteroidales bacterium]
MKRLLMLAAALLTGAVCSAQRFSVGTNLADYADFGTLNVEGDMAVGRRITLVAGAKYNPYLFNADEEPLSARQRLVAAGVRFWPWHVFSGWWLGGKIQYQEYNRGGIRSAETDEGDRYGAGLSAGFSYMLHPHFNVSVGAGLWAGYQRYKTYSCPVCGMTEEVGEKTFLLPNDILLSLSYVF